MEQYYGLETETLIKMRSDLVAALNKAVDDNDKYPKDGLIYVRVRRIARDICDLTTELESRFDEIIEPI